MSESRQKLIVMLSVSYAGKNLYSASKTSGFLRGGVSGANRGYVLAHCAPLRVNRTDFGMGGPVPPHRRGTHGGDKGPIGEGELARNLLK